MNGVEFVANFPELARLAEACARDEEFNRCFGTEEACRQWFFRARWPTGFVCPRCGGRGATWHPARDVWQCGNCRKQTSLTAGTLLQATRKPLRTWFEAAYLIVQRGVNARTLQRELGLTYKVAWAWGQKLRAALQPHAIPDAPGPDERYEYDAARTRGGHVTEPHPLRREPCGCSKLRARDWGFPNEMQEEREGAEVLWRRYMNDRREAVLPEDAPPTAHHGASWELLATYAGSLTERHLRAYLDELAFRRNRRGRARDEAALELVRAIAETPPRPYRVIVARPVAAGHALSIFGHRRPSTKKTVSEHARDHAEDDES